MNSSRWLILPAAVVAIVIGVVAYVSFARGRSSDEPSVVAWDRDACAACKMHLGEPAYAAQIRLTDGSTLFFDDHGCALGMIEGLGARMQKVWFRHLRREQWIAGDDVRFVPSSPSPMGFDLGAIDRSEGTGMSLDAAIAKLAERPNDGR